MIKSICFFIALGILLVFFQLENCRAEKIDEDHGKIKLIFYIESPDGKEFLSPFIENSLQKLINSSTNDTLLSQVSSLNLILESNSIQGKIFKEFLNVNLKDTVLNLSDAEIEKYKIIQMNLLDYNLFLKIKINSFQPLLEFQFILFNVINDKSSKSLPVVKTTHKSSSAFIDPNSKSYKEEILFAIKQIFPETNEKPQPIIVSNKPLKDDIYFVPVNDTIRFDASEIDNDSPKEVIKYLWALNDATHAEYKNFKSQKKAVSFCFIATGEYNISLNVSDGLSSSDTILHISVIKPIALLQAYSSVQSLVRKPFRYVRGRDHCYINYENYLYLKFKNAVSPQHKYYAVPESERNRTPEEIKIVEVDISPDDNMIKANNKIHDNSKTPNFNIIKRSDKPDRLLLIPELVEKKSRKYILTVLTSDIGNQQIVTEIPVQFYSLSPLIPYYSLSYYFAKIDDKIQTVNNNIFGLEWHFSNSYSIDLAIGFFNFKNSNNSENGFAITKINQRIGFKGYFTFLFCKGVEYSLEGFFHRYSYFNSAGDLVYPISVGAGPAAKITLGERVCFGVFCNYFPDLGETNWKYFNLYNAAEIGFTLSYHPFRAVKF